MRLTEKPSLAYGCASIFLSFNRRCLEKWARMLKEDMHPEIRNMKSQEDGQSEFHVVRQEAEKTPSKH